MIYIWGPLLWNFIHQVTYNYPDTPTEHDKIMHKNLLNEVITQVIPCDYCKQNYITKINKYKIDDYLENKVSLINWGINMHNLVNRENDKIIRTFQECHNIYLSELDHNKLFKLLKFYSDWARRDIYAISKFKIIVKYVIIFFPCLKCRNVLYDIIKNNISDVDRLHKIIYKLSNMHTCII